MTPEAVCEYFSSKAVKLLTIFWGGKGLSFLYFTSLAKEQSFLFSFFFYIAPVLLCRINIQVGIRRTSCFSVPPIFFSSRCSLPMEAKIFRRIRVQSEMRVVTCAVPLSMTSLPTAT